MYGKSLCSLRSRPACWHRSSIRRRRRLNSPRWPFLEGNVEISRRSAGRGARNAWRRVDSPPRKPPESECVVEGGRRKSHRYFQSKRIGPCCYDGKTLWTAYTGSSLGGECGRRPGCVRSGRSYSVPHLHAAGCTYGQSGGMHGLRGSCHPGRWSHLRLRKGCCRA